MQVGILRKNGSADKLRFTVDLNTEIVHQFDGPVGEGAIWIIRTLCNTHRVSNFALSSEMSSEIVLI